MTSGLTLNCELNVKGLPLSTQPRLVYLLIETGASEMATASAPVNLGLVVDVSLSMHIRLVNDVQFTQLAQMGLVEEIIADGVPAWNIEDVPASIMQQLPRQIDFVVEALRTALEQLRLNDRFSLVAFAGTAKRLVAISA